MEISDEVWEIAQDLYSDADIDVNQSGQVEDASFMDFDEYNNYYRDCNEADFNKAVDYLNSLLNNEVKFYTDDTRYLELSDNHTLWSINIPEGAEFNDEDYSFMYNTALEHLQDEIGVEVFGLGRSGRHICVEDNFRNLTQLDKFKEAQDKWEDWLIETVENSFKDDTVEEAKELAPDEKVAKCLSCGMKVKYRNRDVQHDAMGDYIECPNCKSTFDVDYDNTPTKKTEGYSLGDDKESFDVYKHTAEFLNKVGKALEDLGWKFNKEKGKFEKEDITIDMEAIQDNVNDLYIGSNKLKLSKFVDDFSGYEDIGEDTGIIYYVSAKAGDYEAKQLAFKINSCEKLEENKEVKTESLGDRYEVWQNYYEDGRTTTEYVMSFDNYAEAQKFASGLMQDPDCEAWVKDREEESKKTEATDYSTFTPTNKVLSGNKGLSEKAINEMRWSLPDLYQAMTDEQKQISKELSLRGMVMSCLVYGNDIHTKENNVSLGKYRGRPYVDEYYDTLGKDVTEEIIKQQTDYFNRGKVIKNVGTDSEGVTYNSFEEPKDESKLTELNSSEVANKYNRPKNPLLDAPYEYFADWNEAYKEDRDMRYSEATPYILDNVKKWIAIRDGYKYIDDYEAGDWYRLQVRETGTKYCNQWVFIEPNKKLWRTDKTADEFYHIEKTPRFELNENKKVTEDVTTEQLPSSMLKDKIIKIAKSNGLTVDNTGKEWEIKDGDNVVLYITPRRVRHNQIDRLKLYTTEYKSDVANKFIDELKANNLLEQKGITLGESKKTEAEDMTQVKDAIETAVEKSDSTDLEKEQVKGSLDVLKTDEESAIEGYEDFKSETEKVADEELADAVNSQMEEIIDDEKEHIEKLDTIKSALGESKKVEAKDLYGEWIDLLDKIPANRLEDYKIEYDLYDEQLNGDEKPTEMILPKLISGAKKYIRNEKVEADSLNKKEELFNNSIDLNINANDVASGNTLDLGGLGDVAGMAGLFASEENLKENKYSDVYKYKGKAFSYNKDDAIVEYVWVDPDTNEWVVIDEIGLSNDNWENRKLRDAYLDEYIRQLDDEANRLADDFIANEFLGESLNQKINRKLQESRGRFDRAELVAVKDSIDTALDDLQIQSDGTTGAMADKVLVNDLRSVSQSVGNYLNKVQEGKDLKHPELNNSVKAYYADSFGKDELNSEIKEVTFLDLYRALKNKQDVYDLIGVRDSVVRERLFAELARILNQPIAYVNNIWQYGVEDGQPNIVKEDKETGTIRQSLNTGVLPIVNVDLYSLYSSGWFDNLVLDDDSNAKFDEIIQDIAPRFIKETLQDILPSVEIYATGVYHPREYNYGGDELEFDLVVNANEYNALKEKALSSDMFETYLKDNYSSRSGFISSMPDDIDEFNNADEWKQMVQVIMFALKDTALTDVNEAYLNDFSEAVNQEFPYVDVEIENAVDELEYKASKENITLDVDYVTNYIKEQFGNTDSYDYILEEVLRSLNLTEGVKVDEAKKEELFNTDVNVNIDAGDIASGNNLDLGGLGEIASAVGLMASEENTKSDKEKLAEDSDDEIPVVNPDEQDYYDNKGYIISLYPRSRSNVNII